MNTDYKIGNLIYDADIYDGMNTHIDDLRFYKKWLPKNKNAKILELCCGTDRLTLPIAKDGYSICGVDYTPSILEQARAKAAEEGIIIDFIEADIRTLNLQEKFDLSLFHLTQSTIYIAMRTYLKHWSALKPIFKKEGYFCWIALIPTWIYYRERKGRISNCQIHNGRWTRSIDKANDALRERNPNQSYRVALSYKQRVSFDPKSGYEIVFPSRIGFIFEVGWVQHCSQVSRFCRRTIQR